MRQQRWMVPSLAGLMVVVAACGSTVGTAPPASTANGSIATLAPSQAASPTATAPALEHGQFTPLGSAGASLETATRLADGRVLLAGGVACASSGSCPNTGEARLFDPATNTFSVVGPLAIARSELTATLLRDGSVLIAGGADETAVELFSPETGKFTSAASLSIGRHNPAAATLSDGRVLVTGGWGGGRGNVTTSASAELYDPAAKSFSPTGSMKTARSGGTATMLKDGRVLIAGGRGKYPNDGLASAELYDPSTGTFTETGSMKAARQNPIAVLLPDGRVLVFGGEVGVIVTTLVEVYDPSTGTFGAAGTMPSALLGVSATLLADGRVLVAGGRAAATEDDALTSNAIADAYIYDPATTTFIPAGSMTVPRNGHTATLLNDGRVLITGGWNESGQLTSAELWQP
jgi:N-acetylneuraminic acid mutarotase